MTSLTQTRRFFSQTTLWLGILSLPGVATAQETAGQEPLLPVAETIQEDAPGEVIIVEDQAVLKAREEVRLALRDMGYTPKHVIDGRQVFVNESAWKPWIYVDDEGWMYLRRAPPRFEKPDLPGVWNGPLGYLVCVTAPTSCVHIGGWVVSKRKLQHVKTAIVDETAAEMQVYQEAVQQVGMSTRVDQELPAALDALWNQGLPLDNAEGHLDDFAERRQAILLFWISRNDDEWGNRVRTVVEGFIDNVIQESQHPYTPQEIASANASRRCARELQVEMP